MEIEDQYRPRRRRRRGIYVEPWRRFRRWNKDYIPHPGQKEYNRDPLSGCCACPFKNSIADIPKDTQNKMHFVWDRQIENFNLDRFNSEKAQGRITKTDLFRVLKQLENQVSDYRFSIGINAIPIKILIFFMFSLYACTLIALAAAKYSLAVLSIVLFILSYVTIKVLMNSYDEKVKNRAKKMNKIFDDITAKEFYAKGITVQTCMYGAIIQVLIHIPGMDEFGDLPKKVNIIEQRGHQAMVMINPGVMNGRGNLQAPPVNGPIPEGAQVVYSQPQGGRNYAGLYNQKIGLNSAQMANSRSKRDGIQASLQGEGIMPKF